MSAPSSAPRPASGSPWSHIRRLQVISPAGWVRLGRLPADVGASAAATATPYRLVPTPAGTSQDLDADGIRVSLPPGSTAVVRLLLAPGWDPDLHLLAHGGRFGYDHSERRTAFRSVTATVGADSTVELPVVDRLSVANDGGTVNVREVRDRLDLRTAGGPICVNDARRARAELAAGRLGLISFAFGDPPAPRIHDDSGTIRWADGTTGVRQRKPHPAGPASSVDIARSAFGPPSEPGPDQGPADPRSDQAEASSPPPAQTWASRSHGRRRR